MRTDAAAYIAAGAAVVMIGAILLRAWVMRRPSPEELEKRRRLALNQFGKLSDGLVLEIHGSTIEYSYDLHGLGYTATQDVSALLHLLPADLETISGAAAVKYDPRNPANSIVVCEDWSGLRPLTGTQPVAGTPLTRN